MIQINLDNKKHPVTLESGYELSTFDRIAIVADASGRRYKEPFAAIPFCCHWLRHGDRISGAMTYFERIGKIARADRKAIEAAALAVINGMSEEEANAKYPGAAPYEPPVYTPSEDMPLRVGSIDRKLHWEC